MREFLLMCVSVYVYAPSLHNISSGESWMHINGSTYICVRDKCCCMCMRWCMYVDMCMCMCMCTHMRMLSYICTCACV